MGVIATEVVRIRGDFILMNANVFAYSDVVVARHHVTAIRVVIRAKSNFKASRRRL